MSASILAFLLAATIAAEPRLTVFPVPRGDKEFNRPYAMVAGPDGALWFTARSPIGQYDLGRITTGGTITLFRFPSDAKPSALTVGADGLIWAGDWERGVLWRIHEDGRIERVDHFRTCAGLALGPDGALWCATYDGESIMRRDPSGAVTEWRLPNVRPATPPPPPGARPWGIAAGPDGALWFTEANGHRIGRITTAGQITQYQLPEGIRSPKEIVAGRDGALWFTQDLSPAIGRITTSGEITEYPIGSPATSIAAGRDGRIWFTEFYASRIGYVDRNGEVVEIDLPGPRMWPHGIAIGADRRVWFTDPLTESIGRLDMAPSRRKR